MKRRSLQEAPYIGVINQPACYILLRRGNEVLFVLRANTGYHDGEYCLPAGRVEKGETFSEGAVREALEEVGVTVDSHDLNHVLTQHRLADHKEFVCVDVFFEVDDWKGTPENMEPDKHSLIKWFQIDQLPNNVMDYQKHALSQIALGKSYAEFGWSD